MTITGRYYPLLLIDRDRFLEAAPTPVWIGREEELLEANRPAAEFFGVGSPERLAGRSALAVVQDDERERARERNRRIIEAGERIDTMEGEIVAWDGQHRYGRFAAAPTEYEGETAVMVVAQGITERREYEQQLARERNRLAEFASLLSHDIRNPLNVATGRVELAAEECDSDHLDVAERSLARIEEIVEDMLVLARPGEDGGETSPVALADLRDGCWSNVASAGATLDCEADLTIRADESRVAQLLENPFRNAVEHGGEDVTITVGELPDSAGFFVEDDGPGIPPDDLERVFDAGYSTTDDGTGFGLSIVEDIAEAHGWEIRAAEGSDGGARFEITAVDTG